jgi:hypothetical protein
MRLKRMRNETVREMMEVEKDVTGEVQKRRFGHGNGMVGRRWPRESTGWVQQEESKRGRP